MIFLTNNRILFFFLSFSSCESPRSWTLAHGTLTHSWFLFFFLPRPNFRFVPPGHHQNGACVDGLLYDKSRKTNKKQTRKTKIKLKKQNKKGVDYCASANRVCHARAQCINLQTTYACHCSPGYTGDGKHCSGTYLHNETKTKKQLPDSHHKG